MAVAVVLGSLLAVRASQGVPPAATWAELSIDSPGPAQALVDPGDRIRVAQPGDTYWDLATELVPDADPRPIVDALVAANGGTAIDVGQRIVIPAELIGRD